MRIAVVLFNLGGPASLDGVKPFLFNLFHDPAIIRLPQPLRWIVASLISSRRAPTTREIYRKIGGASPILGQTQTQAVALEQALESEGVRVETFIAMRYAPPRATDVVADVKAYKPDRIVLLPLYPQFSTTTTKSSVAEWKREAEEIGLSVPTDVICCYPQEAGFVAAQAALIRDEIAKLPTDARYRVLLSAHGLPKSVVKDGDPYQAQVEQTAAAIVAELAIPGLDSQVCYQSRVGPLEWIGPSTDEEIRRAGASGASVIVAPIAFVSEHSETLVELDIDYALLAKESGVPRYLRVPAVGTHPAFIKGLGRLIREGQSNTGIRSGAGGRTCPQACKRCALEEAA